MLQLDDAPTIKGRSLMTNSDNTQAPEQPPTPAPEIRPMEPNERIIRANGVDLCLQTFGDRADSPILLIMGGASSMDLLALERVGHEVPPRTVWDVVVPAILRHTASAP
jgi:hypothetical protein